MKNSLEIIQDTDGRFILIDGFHAISKGNKVINKNGHGLVKIAKDDCGTLGYIGHGGASFLYFREDTHRRFVKYITKNDLKKILPVRNKQNLTKQLVTL